MEGGAVVVEEMQGAEFGCWVLGEVGRAAGLVEMDALCEAGAEEKMAEAEWVAVHQKVSADGSILRVVSVRWDVRLTPAQPFRPHSEPPTDHLASSSTTLA